MLVISRISKRLFLDSYRGMFQQSTITLHQVGYDSPVSSKSHSKYLFTLQDVWRLNEEQMEANAEQEILVRKKQLLDEELDKFLNGTNTSNYHSKTDTWMALYALKLPYSSTGGLYILSIGQLQSK